MARWCILFHIRGGRRCSGWGFSPTSPAKIYAASAERLRGKPNEKRQSTTKAEKRTIPQESRDGFGIESSIPEFTANTKAISKRFSNECRIFGKNSFSRLDFRPCDKFRWVFLRPMLSVFHNSYAGCSKADFPVEPHSFSNPNRQQTGTNAPRSIFAPLFQTTTKTPVEPRQDEPFENKRWGSPVN